MPRIRLLEAGPNDGVEFDVPTLPQVWYMPAPFPPGEIIALATPDAMPPRMPQWEYIPIGWMPNMASSPNAKQFMSPRQFDEVQGYYRSVSEPAVMYVRKEQMPKLARRVG